MSDDEGRVEIQRAEPPLAAWQRVHDHAWRYFELHAGQRLAIFNFFTVLGGFATAGIAATLQGSTRFSMLGVALGALLVLLSFVFWKLDQRAAFLVKHAERVQELAEIELLPPRGHLIAAEPSEFATAREDRSILGRPWTFGASFRLIFVIAALFGTGAAVLCGLRAAGVVEWSAETAANHPTVAASKSKHGGAPLPNAAAPSGHPPSGQAGSR